MATDLEEEEEADITEGSREDNVVRCGEMHQEADEEAMAVDITATSFPDLLLRTYLSQCSSQLHLLCKGMWRSQ